MFKKYQQWLANQRRMPVGENVMDENDSEGEYMEWARRHDTSGEPDSEDEYDDVDYMAYGGREKEEEHSYERAEKDVTMMNKGGFAKELMRQKKWGRM